MIALDLCQDEYQTLLIIYLKDCISCLDYITIKDEQNYEKDINKELIKIFANIYEFCNEDINKFILLLGKVVYRYEYMDSFDEI